LKLNDRKSSHSQNNGNTDHSDGKPDLKNFRSSYDDYNGFIRARNNKSQLAKKKRQIGGQMVPPLPDRSIER
jgi:hypothetical protein